MENEKIYNGIYPKEDMAKAEKGTTIFLSDEDIVKLLSSKKIEASLDNNETISIAHLQGSIVEKKPITPFGKKGYFHIAVNTLGESYSDAYVVPAVTSENGGTAKPSP